MEKVSHANGNQKKVRAATLISHKIGFTIKTKRQRYFIKIKGLVQDIIVNLYAPNTAASKYRRQILTDIKGETDSNKIILGDFNTTFTSIDR